MGSRLRQYSALSLERSERAFSFAGDACPEMCNRPLVPRLALGGRSFLGQFGLPCEAGKPAPAWRRVV